MAKPTWLILAEYLPVKMLLVLFRFLPYALVFSLGRLLGRVSYFLLKDYREVCKINLNIAFKGRLSPQATRTITKAAFVNMLLTYVEFISSPRFKDREFIEKTETRTFEHFSKAKEKAKGVIVCCFHYSNWYWPALYYGVRGGRVHAVTRVLDNPLLNREMNRILEDRGVVAIPREVAVKKGLDVLRRGEVLALMVDQNAAYLPTFVPFFGVEAASMRGAVALAKKTGATVLCVLDKRQGKRHALIISKPFKDFDDEAEGLAKIYRWFEKKIEEDPQLYFWLHPRWKKRPEGEKSFYQGLKV